MTAPSATRRFDAVLFDAGGVLVLPDAAVLGPLLAPYGGATDGRTHTRAHYAGMAAKSRAGSDESDWRAYDHAYARHLGVGPDDLDEAADLLGRTRSAHLWRAPIAGAAETLARLAAAGVEVGVVSNASGQIEAILRRFAVCQVGEGPGASVRCVVDSEVVGVAKPDPRIFDFALEVLEVPTERIAYVGDSVAMDVVGARAAGLHPLHLDPFDDWSDADHERIRGLAELLAWC